MAHRRRQALWARVDPAGARRQAGVVPAEGMFLAVRRLGLKKMNDKYLSFRLNGKIVNAFDFDPDGAQRIVDLEARKKEAYKLIYDLEEQLQDVIDAIREAHPAT